MGDAGERDLVMEVGRGGNGDGVDAFGEQFVQACEGAAAGQIRGTGPMRLQWIDDANQRNIRQARQDAGMVGAHDACADHANAQRVYCVGLCARCPGIHMIDPNRILAE